MPNTVEYICQNMARELKVIFGDSFPDYEEGEFYVMDIGTVTLMRGCMAKQQLFEQLENYFESEFSDIHPTARSGTQTELT